MTLGAFALLPSGLFLAAQAESAKAEGFSQTENITSFVMLPVILGTAFKQEGCCQELMDPSNCP